jgi:phosphotransferase system HPr-like phosphotransfer protein
VIISTRKKLQNEGVIYNKNKRVQKKSVSELLTTGSIWQEETQIIARNERTSDNNL